MNALEHELSYPLGDALPEWGRTLEVAPGVRWVRMGLPFALDHINLWLLRDEIDGRDGWTIVAPPGKTCSPTSWAACRCCVSSSPTCIRTTSGWRTG
jgi:hypothetical protein